MASRKLLVVSGDYAVVQQVKQALGGKDFTIHSAYSHLDAVYQLKFENFELALIDAAMIHRKTGEQTATALAQADKHPPLLVYAAGGGVVGNGAVRAGADTAELAGKAATEIHALDEATLEKAIASVLQLPSPTATMQVAAFVDGGEKGSAPEPKMRLHNTSIFWRDEEMQTLFALGRSLTEVLELSEVLNRIVEAARRLTNAEEGMILLPDGQSNQLYLRAKVGIDNEVADNFRIKTQDTIAGAVFESGKSVLLGESGPQKVKTEYFVNSLLYVPIIHNAQTLGVLGVNNKQKHDVFSERHHDLLINLASYAAIAIENARIHGQTIRRTHELKTLIDASQAINASLSFGHTLAAICEHLVSVLDVSHAEIYDPTLHLLARSQRACWRPGHEPPIPLTERPLIKQAIESRKPVFVARDQDEALGARNRLQQLGAGASLVLPILGGERVMAVVQAYYILPPPSVPASEAMNRAQRIVLESMAGVGASSDSVMDALGNARTALGADWIEFMQADGGTLKLQFSVGSGVWADEPRPLIDAPDLQRVLQTQQPLNYVQNEDDITPSLRALLRLSHCRSVLALPLMGHGRALGLVLFGDAPRSRAFSPREIDLGRAIVGQAATALENVGLVRDLEASLVELKETQNRLVQGARLSAMGELAAAVAHQINNPLTTIVLDTELLLESAAKDKERYSKDYEVINAISRSGKRAAGVVRRLLAMARPTSGDTPRVAVDVIDTITDIVSLVRPHIEREGIRLIVELPEEGDGSDHFPPVMAVPDELNDVWLNLILNAHDAVMGREAPAIGVTADYQAVNGMIEVTVWDNGTGIPAELVGEIFKPFFTTKPQGEGTGLGLHICRQVVDRVGGAISVQTTNTGTQFVVRLPIMRST
jgi:signal transduction histidine kinase/ActR/RegA family two-component response regulator